MLLPLDLRRQARLVAVDVGLCRRAREEETEGGADLAVPVDDGGSAAGIIKTHHQVDCSLLLSRVPTADQCTEKILFFPVRTHGTPNLFRRQAERVNQCVSFSMVGTYYLRRARRTPSMRRAGSFHTNKRTLYICYIREVCFYSTMLNVS